jgi:uncharacterized SAM-binding protein YcdF (DUF218 family)
MPTYIVESWFLTMGLTLGWLGLLWAIAFPLILALMAYRILIRRRDPLPAIALAAVAPAIVLVGLLLPTMMEPQIALFPWAMCGLAVVALEDRGQVRSFPRGSRRIPGSPESPG